MKKFLTLTLTLLMAGGTICGTFAQTKKVKGPQKVVTPNYELASRFSAAKTYKMVFSTQIRPNWFASSDKFWYSWKTSEGTRYYVVDPVKGTKTEIFDMARLAMQITEIMKDPFDARHLPIQNLRLRDDKVFTFEVVSSQDKPKEEWEDPLIPEKKTYFFEYELAARKLKDVTAQMAQKDEKYPDWASISPDGTKGVYVKDYNLYMMDSTSLRKAAADPKDSTIVEIRLTRGGEQNYEWAGNSYRGSSQKDTTERSYADIQWSPNSKHFATMRWDLRSLEDLWVINSTSKPRPTLKTYKYQMPGEPGGVGDLYLFDTEGRTHKLIKTHAFKDQEFSIESAPSKAADRHYDYQSSIWLGDNESFYVTRYSRDLKRVDFCRVWVDGDSTNVVIKERMNTYIETRTLVPINSGKQLIHWSERNGWANLYLYEADGTLIRNLTDGAYHVEDVLAVNEKEGYVLFNACGVNPDENPYQMHTYRVSLKGGEIRQLDMPDMDVLSKASDDAKFFVANYSRVDAKPAVALYNASGKKVLDLEEADFSLLFAAGYKFPERFKVKAADGVTDLYGVMYKPFDFDSTKVYPVCDYVYPGPQVEAVNISWSRGFTRTDRLAQLGFIVVTVGNRGGHPNRSKWYHNYGYGNLRDYGLEDQKYAIQQLCARHSFMDIERVGIHGHSGGGFMSTAAILTYPDFFKAAVSCAGNHDNRIYNRWWSEQHHGILEKVNDGDTTFVYSIKTNQELVRALKGHLMLVTGDIDDNVNPANTYRVVDALIRCNKRFELVVLPGQKHGFGYMDEFFFWKMADWYCEWLMGSTAKRSEVDIVEMNND